MSAEILRKAADEARKHAAGGRTMAALTSAMGDDVAAEAARVVARHEAVADLLDRAADDHDETPCPVVDAAIAVARAYLGEAS